MWNLIRDEVLRPRQGVRPLDLEVIELAEDRIMSWQKIESPWV